MWLLKNCAISFSFQMMVTTGSLVRDSPHSRLRARRASGTACWRTDSSKRPQVSSVETTSWTIWFCHFYSTEWRSRCCIESPQAAMGMSWQTPRGTRSYCRCTRTFNAPGNSSTPRKSTTRRWRSASTSDCHSLSSLSCAAKLAKSSCSGSTCTCFGMVLERPRKHLNRRQGKFFFLKFLFKSCLPC